MFNLSTVIDRISAECEKNGISVNQMLIASMAGKSLVDNMKRGRNPSIDKLYLVASFLNTTSDYLLGLTDEINNQGEKHILSVTQSPGHDEQRQQLLDNYDKMNEDGKNELVGLSEIISGNPKYLKAGNEDNKIVS